MIPAPVLAALALCFYALHAGYHIAEGHAGEALWACHVANVVAAAGLWQRSPRALTVAIQWLVLGNAMWVLYLTDGGTLLPTSLLTHLGGLVVALVGCRRYGVVRGSWRVATAGLVSLQVVSRLLTPARDNVNIAWRVYDGWEKTFPNYALYLVLMDCLAMIVFVVVEQALRRLATSSSPRE